MAMKLPDSGALGQRRFVEPDRGIASVRNAGQLYEAGEQAAVQSARAIGRATDVVDNVRDGMERMAFSRAKSAFLKASIEADGQFDEDKEHGTWEPRYRKQMEAIRDRFGATLSGPYKDLFDDETGISIARGAEKLKDKANVRIKDEGRAAAWDAINQNLELALNAKDEETRAEIMRATGDTIQAAKDSGFYSAAEAAQQLADVDKRFRADFKARTLSLLETDLDKWRNKILGDPSMLKGAEVELIGRIDQSGLSEAEKTKARRHVLNGLGLSAVQSQILNDPVRAKSALESGAWDGYLDADRKASARIAADQQIKINDAQAKSAAAEARERFTSDLTIGVHRGVKGYTDIEDAYQKGSITPGTRTMLTTYLDKETERQQTVSNMIARVESAREGGQPLDPKSKADKDALNLHYDAAMKGWKQDEVVTRSLDYSYKYGIVPEKFRGVIRGNLRSGDPAQAVMAADSIAQLRNLNPQLLNDFADEDLRLGNMVGSLTSAGLPPQLALVQAQEALKVDKTTMEARQQDYRLQRGKTEQERAQSDKKWIEGKINSFWSSDPTVDPVMHAEFDSLAQSEFVKTGNLDASRQFALDHVNRMWGRTEVGGSRRYMKWAPENFYGVSTLSPSANAKWMNEQLVTDLSKGALSSPDNPLTSDRVVLMPDPSKINQGRPVYQVSIKGTDGILHSVTDKNGRPLSWVPDWNSSEAKTRMEEKARLELEEARRLREEYLSPSVGPEMRLNLTPETASKSGVSVMR